MKHFLTLLDLAPEDINYVVHLSSLIKTLHNDLGISEMNLLKGAHVALIFQKPSTRTRVSLEVAIRRLGGVPLYLRWDELQLARGETIHDTIKVLERYVGCVVARVYRHQDLVEMAKHGSIPVINALSDLYHPLQAVSDLQTILEVKGSLKGLKVAFIGDGGSNVCHSLMVACSSVGMDFAVACPSRYPPAEHVIREAERRAKASGSEVIITDSPEEAVREADVVYTDVFVSMGKERERKDRLNVFLPRYRVTKKLLINAKRDYVFMHCLPCRRGEEVEADVIDDEEHSIVWLQAENRLYSAEAVLMYVLKPDGVKSLMRRY